MVIKDMTMTTTDPTQTGPTRADPTAQGKTGLHRRFLRPLLFLALDQNEETYGYELAEAVRDYGLAIDMAGVYRELRTMEQHDLLLSRWEASDEGPDRRVYTLTDAGHDGVHHAITSLRTARDLLSAALTGLEADVGATRR